MHRFSPTDHERAVVPQPHGSSLIHSVVGRLGSIEADVALAVVPVFLWLIGGMAGSSSVEVTAHVAIIALLLFTPRAGMLAVIPLLPFQHAMPFPPHGPIVAYAVAIALAITVRAARGGITIPVIARPAVWLAVALLVVTVFQATLGLRLLGGVLPLSVLSELNQVVIVVMVFVGSVAFLRRDGVVPAVVGYLVSFITVSGVGILHFLRPSVLGRLDILWMVSPDATRFRATGVIPNANFLGLFIGIGVAWLIALSAWYLSRGRAMPAILALIAGSPGIMALLLTMSRAAIVAVGLGVVIAVARWSRRAAIGMLVAGAIVAMIAYPVFLQLRLGQTFGSGGHAGQAAQAESDDLRASQALAAVEAFMDAPLLGNGFATFSVVSPRYSGQDVLTSAHNAYLKLAAEQGIVGVGLFIAFLATIGVGLWRARPGPWSAGLAVLGVIAVFALAGDILTSAQSTASGFVLLAVMLVAAEATWDPFHASPSDTGLGTPEAA